MIVLWRLLAMPKIAGLWNVMMMMPKAIIRIA